MDLKLRTTLALTIFNIGVASSQNDTLNQYNAKGKKDGYCRVYFDKHLQKVDSSKAFYYGFDLYVDGANRTEIFSMKRIDTSRIEHVNRLTTKSGTLTLLDGEFVYYSKNGKTKFIDTYKQGCVQTMSVYNIDSNNPISDCRTEHLDFTKKYNNQRGSFYSEERSCNLDRAKAYWVGMKEGKWKAIKIEDFKPSEREQQIKEKIK